MPTARLLVVSVHSPPPSDVPGPRSVPTFGRTSQNSTESKLLGVPAPGTTADTVAVSVTDWPNTTASR